ncbi:MAG: class I SAM-dependent methyltransferase [Deltaproteobacteria bacterium]|nr:class I SAM-dependent methyltransferase [Deltaproteobacteria bacterium]
MMCYKGYGAVMCADYWNDEEIERSKSYWIEDVDDPRLLNHLRTETNLERCFCDALAFVESHLGGMRGTVLELGAGVCWTSAIISRHADVEKIIAVDISKHRLFRLAPLVFRQYQALEHKIKRVVDSAENIAFKEDSIDAVVFCQALYMLAEPGPLLRRIYRYLKPDGLALVTCEHIEGPKSWRRRGKWWMRSLLSGRLAPKAPADDSGRHS